MTSKEALEYIKAFLKTEAFLAYEDIQKELKLIEKDLEVLELLKRILKIHLSSYYGMEIVVRGTDEQENKIKEWLEQ